MPVAASVNRLRDQPSKSKLIVLLTDGQNNAGKISPSPDAVKTDTVEEAVESLRGSINFDSRGINTFRITYSDEDKKRAQHRSPFSQ